MKTLRQLGKKLGPVVALLILFVFMSFANETFLTANNMMNILRQTAVNAMIAAAMLVVLITAGIDLSVGANAILSACMMGMLIQNYNVTNPLILILVLLTTGATVGFLNGIILTKLKLPHPFVSTLGMKNVLAGLALFVVSAKTVSNFPDTITWLGSANLFRDDGFSGFPIAFITVIAVYIILHIVLNRTVFGKSVFCVGGNPEATRLSGINSDKVLIAVYTLSGVLCAIAGLIIVGRSGIANPSQATSTYDTDAIAACIIGGASFQGGKGTMFGTMIGALMISTLRNGLTLLNAQADVQFIIIGLVIIVAVFVDITRVRMEEKSRRLSVAK